MSDFITIEDVNGMYFRPVNEIVKLHTSDISKDEFSNGKLDFCIISHSISGDTHTFTFEVQNDLWKGKCYVLYPGARGTVSYNNGKITVVTQHDHIWLAVYLCSYDNSTFVFNHEDFFIPQLNCITVKKNEIGTSKTVTIIDPLETIISKSFTLSEGVVSVNDGYVLVLLEKTDFICNINQTVTVGRVNHVRLNTDSKYLPNGSMIGSEPMVMEVKYNDTVIPVTYDSVVGDYCFDLDLTDKKDITDVNFELIVYENKYVKQAESEVKLHCQYLQVGNFSDLINEILSGAEIIELSDDVTLLSRISINHDLIIYGGNHTLDLNEYGFNVVKDNVFKVENMVFDSGDTAIIQGLNTKVELTECTFTNCQSSNYNDLGSVIYCDVDIESLSDGTDFTTILNACEFYDNHSAIFHGGELDITDCRMHNTDTSYVEPNNPAFIYQTDGTCTITDSIFDIDYTSNTFCTNEINIGFAQALIRCGQSAIINGALGSNLNKDESLPFFDGVFNNRSHVFAKYYYPQIEACVFTSPVTSMEDKAICYAVSGSNNIFKENVQVTRASDNTENTIRKIIWED